MQHMQQLLSRISISPNREPTPPSITTMTTTTISKAPCHRRAASTIQYSNYDGGLAFVDSSADVNGLFLLFRPAGFFVRQLDAVLTTVASVVSAFLSLFSHSKASAEEAPAKVASHGLSLLRKLALGLLGAAYVCLVLAAVLVVAVVIGVGLVRWWVEEPISMRKPVYFDYTEGNPSAVVAVGGGGGDAGRGKTVPVGHEFLVSLELLLPESDYNRQIGIFQVTAEALASSGDPIAGSGQPCMLRFRSAPLRLMRTFVLGVPLVLGFSSETQTLAIDLLRHRERLPRTEAVRVTLKPRAGTLDLPQIYAADLVLNSQLPWRKQLAYNWKWTFYVWASLYVYAVLLLLVVCYLRPFRLPWWRGGASWVGRGRQLEEAGRDVGHAGRKGEWESSEEFEEALRRWRSRRRLKTVFAKAEEEAGDSGGAAMSEEGPVSNAGEVIDESGDFAESESSECVGG